MKSLQACLGLGLGGWKAQSSMERGFDVQRFADRRLLFEACEAGLEEVEGMVDGVWVNSLVLCSQSDVFNAMLHDGDMQETRQCYVVLEVDESLRRHFRLMLRCAYAQGVGPLRNRDVGFADVMHVATLADKYGFGLVLSKCLLLLAEVATSKPLLLNIPVMEQLLCLPGTITEVQDFAGLRTGSRLYWGVAMQTHLSQHKDFMHWPTAQLPGKLLTLPPGCMRVLLQSDQLVVRSEDEVLYVAVCYAQQRLTKQELPSFVCSCVRLHHLSPEAFLEFIEFSSMFDGHPEAIKAKEEAKVHQLQRMTPWKTKNQPLVDMRPEARKREKSCALLHFAFSGHELCEVGDSVWTPYKMAFGARWRMCLKHTDNGVGLYLHISHDPFNEYNYNPERSFQYIFSAGVGHTGQAERDIKVPVRSHGKSTKVFREESGWGVSHVFKKEDVARRVLEGATVRVRVRVRPSEPEPPAADDSEPVAAE